MKEKMTICYTPDNEPYLGRELLLHFDQIICSAMEQNSKISPYSHGKDLSHHQRMACIIIPQALSIMLSIRELIRQGYLFGAKVLTRSLVERAAILLYLYHYPTEIEKWNKGWHFRDAPSLSKMFEKLNEKNKISIPVEGYKLTAEMNSILHAKPDSAFINTVELADGGLGYAVSKMLSNPKLCDDICADVLPWVAVIQAMASFYFLKND